MTTVRGLTEGEKGELAPLLRELHAHVERCADCQAAPAAASAAEMGAANMCAVGAEMYLRWLAWLARS